MESEIFRLLIDAGTTVILAITLVIVVRGQNMRDNASQMTAKANLLLSASLDKFSETAIRNAELALVQKAAINAVGEVLTGHDTRTAEWDVASIARDKATLTAITELPSKMRLVIEEETNELQLQILVAFQDFMSQLRIREAEDQEVTE